jgi:hypothetical protein
LQLLRAAIVAAGSIIVTRVSAKENMVLVVRLGHVLWIRLIK